MERVKNSKTLKLLLSLIILFFVLIISKVAYSFLGPSIDDRMNMRGSVKAGGYSLNFSQENTLEITASSDNFSTTDGNLTVSNTPSATLSAVNMSNVNETYNVGINIKKNTFKYSTIGNTAELILTIADENGTPVTTSSDTLSYVTVGSVSGFDVTNKNDVYNIVVNHPISASNSTTVHNWTFTLTFVNLETDQIINETAVFSADIVFQKSLLTSSTLVDGSTFNSKLKSLAAGSTVAYDANDNLIKSFQRANSLPNNFTETADNTISLSTDTKKIYIWFVADTVANDGTGTIYYYTEADKIFLNADASNLFRRFRVLTDISGLEDFDCSNVTTLYYVFGSCVSLTNLNPIKNWNTSNVESLQGAFCYIPATNLNTLVDWDTSQVTTMQSMFYECHNLIDISGLKNWDTSSLQNMYRIFYYCDSLTTLNGLDNWDVSSANTFSGLFYNCTSLETIDALRTWDVSQVQNMQDLFYNCSSLASLNALKNWKTTSLTSLLRTFRGCTSLTNIDGLEYWDTSHVTNMDQTFHGNTALTNVNAVYYWEISIASSFTNILYQVTCAKPPWTGTWNSAGTFTKSA